MFSFESAPQRMLTPWFAIAVAGMALALLSRPIAGKCFPEKEGADTFVRLTGLIVLALGAVLMICFGS